MHSDDTAPSCRLCPQPRNAVALRTEMKDLGIADYRPRQVHAEETHPPFYSWGDVRPARWDWPSESPHSPCTCVTEIRRECGCIQRWYHPDLRFNACRVFPHLKVRGQRYYREVSYVSEQHYRDPGHTDQEDTPSYIGHRRRVSFQNHEEQRGINGPSESRCNGIDPGEAAFFPTEVPPGKLGRSRANQSDVRTPSQGSESWESCGKSRGTVRDRIKQVVTELEEVLGGLKQVQLEMKEVVQQIDILTSNIDLSKDSSPSIDFLQDERHRSATSDLELPPKSSPETWDSSFTHRSVSVDSFLMNNPSATRNHTSSSPLDRRPEINFVHQFSESHRTGQVNGTCLPHRTCKIRANGEPENRERTKSKNPRPPLYPQNEKTRTAPGSGKHKTLSSSIV